MNRLNIPFFVISYQDVIYQPLFVGYLFCILVFLLLGRRAVSAVSCWRLLNKPLLIAPNTNSSTTGSTMARLHLLHCFVSQVALKKREEKKNFCKDLHFVWQFVTDERCEGQSQCL